MSTVTFENVCRAHAYETSSLNQNEQVQYVYHCCLCLIFDQTTMVQKQKKYLREGYLQEKLLTELIAPGFLNHTISMSILTFYFSLPLCCCCFLIWRLVLKRFRRKSWNCVYLVNFK